MAATFVPVPFFADWTAAWTSRTMTRRESPIQTTASIHHKALAPECTSGLRGAGASEEFRRSSSSSSRPRPGVLNGALKPLEGGVGGSWVERPPAPTLLGYEILEERAKFTIYKILVTEGQGKSWVIFRRFVDFCRLHGKLKKLFPSCGLTLPPKRWFKDNYNEEFLERRQIGLQTYLQELTQNKDVISCESVRRFLCLLDPPSPFDSLEESRAFCETLEETNHRLQRELVENQREVDILKKKLEDKEKQISFLVKKVKLPSLSSESFEGSSQFRTSLNTLWEGGGCMQQLTDGNRDADVVRGSGCQRISLFIDKEAKTPGYNGVTVTDG